MIVREPCAPLRGLVERLWVAPGPATGGWEHVLPTGATHLVVRLGAAPLRLRGPDGELREISGPVVGGARGEFYAKERAPGVGSVGAVLRPGAALALLGAPAGALAEQHTPLDALWGDEAARLAERLATAATPAAALAAFEAELSARARRVRGVHPAVAAALGRLAAGEPVAAAAAGTGVGVRRLSAVFHEEVGLAPKRWARVRRLGRALRGLTRGEPLAAVAAAAGYADQAHMTREFAALAGVAPAAYRRLAPEHDHHVPVDGSDPFKTRGRGRGTVRP